MYLPGFVYEVTSRTVGGSYALRPSDESDEIMLGVIGRAQFLYPSVKIYALNPLSTHTTELLGSDRPEELEKFIGFVKSNISREFRTLYGLRYGVFEPKRAHVIPIAPVQSSLEWRLKYVLSQGTKENLVNSPREWDGVTGVHALEHGKKLTGVWFNRTAEGKARRRNKAFGKYTHSTTYEVKLSPLPCWDETNDDWRFRVTEIVDGIAAEAAEAPKTKGEALGMEAVRAFSPTFLPDHVVRSPAPPVLAATPKAYAAIKGLLDSFCNAFEEASRRVKAGIKNVIFPPFSFPPAQPMTQGPIDFDPWSAFQPA